MPAIKAIYEPTNRRLSELGDNERTTRAKEIDKRWEWYHGRHPDTLKPVPNQLNDNLKLNLCGRAVDRLTEFIGRPDLFVLDNENEGRGEQTVADMNQLYNDQLLYLLPEVILETLVTGHAFVKLWMDAENPDAGPQCAMLDSRIVTAYWRASAGNRRIPLWYRVQWLEQDEGGNDIIMRQDIVPRELAGGGGEGWVIYEYSGRGATFTLLTEEAWDHPFSPIVEFRNRVLPWEYYGQSQLSDDVIELNRAVNFLATNTNRILRFHAHPRTVATGTSADKIQATAIDGMYTIPTGATVQNLEMQSDLGSSMAMLQQIKGEFFATIRVTDISSQKDRIGQVTNFGVRMLYSDMLEQIEEKRDSWGISAGQLLLRLCEMAGVTLDHVPYPQWPDALPENRLEKIQAAQIEQQLGVVSRETLAVDLERNWAVERERIAAEGAEANEAAANALNQLAERGAFQ